MYNLECNTSGELPIRFDFLGDAKAFAERVAYDELKWINYDNGWEALDSKGELFKITKTCKSTG